MAALFGSSSSPIIEARIGGTWTDVSSRVRGAQKVTISRGRANEQARVSAQRCNLTFENADGFFSTRVPTSVNYRKIGKNTQVRVRAGDGDNYMRALYNDLTDLAGASTTDKASLDITGDIDLRAEIWPHSWRPRMPMIIAAKYLVTGDQRSWILRLGNDGRLTFGWTTAGTFATLISAVSSPVTIPSGGRLAVRVTLDVDNGSGSRVVTFYTSNSITGTWSTLSTTTTAGTTSIYSGTAALTIGRGDGNQAVFGGGAGWGGKLYRFQMYSGIAGTLVADFNPSSRSIGDTSWSDGLASPNTWTLAGQGIRVTSDRVRFWGELASLPKSWDLSAEDSTVPAQASGLLKRLSQGAKPIDSPMTRNFRGVSSFGWWPLEDASGTTLGANLSPGTSPLAVLAPARISDADYGASDPPPGAKSCLSFNSSASRFYGALDLKELSQTYSFVFYVKLSALPSTSKVFAVIDFFAPISRAEISISSTSWTVEFFDITGVSMGSSSTGITSINPVNGWVGYNLLLQESGADIEYSQRWDTIGTFGGGVGPSTITGGAGSTPRQVRFTAVNDAVFNDMKLSHVFVSSEEFDLTVADYRNASNAYLGETAAARLVRLSTEEGVPMEITGALADSEPMGYQGLKSYPDLIAECWEVDGGIGGDARDALALEYRVRADMEARQDLLLTHSLSDLSEPPQPTDDDQSFSNDVTVTRTGGGAWRAIVTEGYTSIYDPPVGVGRYETGVTLNASTDDRLPSIAGWLALTGSWDQDRYPAIDVALHRSRVLADDTLYTTIVGLRLGDTATLAGLPAWMPPDQVPQIVQGYDEVLSKFLWEIRFNCTPAGPYQAVPQLGLDSFVPRLDANEHTISNSLSTTSTSLTLVTPAGSARWADSATYPSDFPMDIVINGEVMSLTEVTGTTSPQTGTVTRSINGVVKSHDANSLVRLARPFYIGR